MKCNDSDESEMRLFFLTMMSFSAELDSWRLEVVLEKSVAEL